MIKNMNIQEWWHENLNLKKWVVNQKNRRPHEWMSQLGQLYLMKTQTKSWMSPYMNLQSLQPCHILPPLYLHNAKADIWGHHERQAIPTWVIMTKATPIPSSPQLQLKVMPPTYVIFNPWSSPIMQKDLAMPQISSPVTLLLSMQW